MGHDERKFTGKKAEVKRDFWTGFFRQYEKKVSLEYPYTKLECLNYILKAA